MSSPSTPDDAPQPALERTILPQCLDRLHAPQNRVAPIGKTLGRGDAVGRQLDDRSGHGAPGHGLRRRIKSSIECLRHSGLTAPAGFSPYTVM